MTETSRISDIPEDRPLTDRESELVRWLLANGKKGAERYLPQVERARVVQRCGCGCASVDFGLDGNKSNLRGGMEVLSDCSWQTSSGNLCGVFVFAREEHLAGLEVWSIDGGETPKDLPPPSELKPYGSEA